MLPGTAILMQRFQELIDLDDLLSIPSALLICDDSMITWQMSMLLSLPSNGLLEELQVLLSEGTNPNVQDQVTQFNAIACKAVYAFYVDMQNNPCIL